MDPNEGCLTMMRAVARRGVEVGVITGPNSAYARWSRHATGPLLPDPVNDQVAWRAAVEEVAMSGPAAVIPGSDAAVEVLARFSDSIPAGLLCFERDGRHLELMDKDSLYPLAQEAGVRVPWSRPIATFEELDDVAEGCPFPCVVKPALAHVGKRLTGHGTRLVHDAEALARSVRADLELGIDQLATEFIPGPETALEGVVSVRAVNGEYPMAYGRRKVRQWPLDFGAGSLTESAAVPEASEITRHLLEALGFVGVSSVEYKRHADTGELVLMEVNVRLPQSFGLGDACGADASWRVFAALAGLDVGPPPLQRDGRKVLLPTLEAKAVRKRIERGELGVLEMVASWAGTRSVGLLDLRDPGPALFAARRSLRNRRRPAQ